MDRDGKIADFRLEDIFHGTGGMEETLESTFFIPRRISSEMDRDGKIADFRLETTSSFYFED